MIEQHRSAEAFEVLERSRAQSLLDTLAAGRVEIHSAANDQLVQRGMAIQRLLADESDMRIRVLSQNHTEAELKAIDASVSDLLFKKEEIDAEIRLHDPAFAHLTVVEPPSVSEVQARLLDTDTILLEYALGARKSYLFVLTPRSVKVHTLQPRSNIEALARRLHELWRANACAIKESAKFPDSSALPVRETCDGLASRLGKMLLAPAAKEMAGGKRLLIAADGAIQYIPFAGLPEPTRSANETRKEYPLVMEHEIIMLPSASVLAALRLEQEHRPRPSKLVAILADPVFSSRDERVKIQMHTPSNRGIVAALSFPFQHPIDRHAENVPEPGSGRHDSLQLRRLIFSREEAKSIAALIPRDQLMAAMDFGASLATATSRKLAQYRIVHFSTHGVLDSAHPELSGLILSLVDEDGQRQKGFLGYQEIYNLRLPADLVVLSGCDTALGKEIWGEGLVGLTRGFMYAGAARVLASLWEVDDYATAELMRFFYQGLESKQMRPAAALRAAQLKMLQDVRWRSPYFWASFELQGEWK